MLGDITIASELYIVCGYTDMRKSIDGLCCDRIKAILHESDGFVLLYKRLDAHVGRYQWPRSRNEVKSITWRQFDWLMSGLEIEQPKAIQRR